LKLTDYKSIGDKSDEGQTSHIVNRQDGLRQMPDGKTAG
jgi:hypothetical protein